MVFPDNSLLNGGLNGLFQDPIAFTSCSQDYKPIADRYSETPSLQRAGKL